MDRKEFEELTNRWGQQHTPFFFMADFLAEHFFACTLSACADEDISYALAGFTNTPSAHSYSPHFSLSKSPLPFAEYEKGFRKVHESTLYGDSYLSNLCYRTPLEIDLSLQQIYQHGKAPYKLLVKDKFVVFSPESFIEITDNVIRSFPMKGTINARIPNAREELLRNAKERAEHATIVDLIRNDLSIVADQVRLERFMYLSKVRSRDSELYQASSEIVGRVKAEYTENYGSLLLKLLPAGSVSGAPKKRTLEIIAEAEVMPRGFYTGVFGIFDGSHLRSAVMIRFIEKDRDGKFFFWSGGGITSQSNARAEYNELIDKVYVPIY